MVEDVCGNTSERREVAGFNHSRGLISGAFNMMGLGDKL